MASDWFWWHFHSFCSLKLLFADKFSRCSNPLNFETKINCNTIKPNVPKWRKTCIGLKFYLLNFYGPQSNIHTFWDPIFFWLTLYILVSWILKLYICIAIYWNAGGENWDAASGGGEQEIQVEAGEHQTATQLPPPHHGDAQVNIFVKFRQCFFTSTCFLDHLPAGENCCLSIIRRKKRQLRLKRRRKTRKQPPKFDVF